jgi:phosphomannomutase
MINTYRARYPVSGEINHKVKDTKVVIDCIRDQYQAKAKRIDEADGISMEFSDWRFNLRASNTEPLLRLNVESRHDRLLMESKTKELLQSIARSG